MAIDPEKLQPGSELDSLVAEKVMGWRKRKDGHTWEDSMGGRMAYSEDGPWLDYGDQPWSPSDDIRAAWEVVEELEAQGIRLWHLGREDSLPDWRVELGRNHQPSLANVESATICLAICRAALKAVGA